MISMRSSASNSTTAANQNLRRSSRFRKSAVQYCQTIDEETFEEQKVREVWQSDGGGDGPTDSHTLYTNTRCMRGRIKKWNEPTQYALTFKFSKGIQNEWSSAWTLQIYQGRFDLEWRNEKSLSSTDAHQSSKSLRDSIVIRFFLILQLESY